MKSVLFAILLFALFSLVSAASPVRAQDNGLIPATHMWAMTGNALVFVPARSLEQCIMLVQQASNINSSTGECYNDNQFLKKIRCTKPFKKGAKAACDLEE